jgi:hypothetical protein
VAIAGSDEAMGRGTERIRRRPMHAEVCEPILPGDFVGESDPLGSMTSLWSDRIDEVLDRWYG